MSAEETNILQQIKQESDFFVKARLLNKLKRDKQMPIKHMAKELGMKEAYVCHILRLLKLPEIVLDGYYSKLISVSHLFIIARLRDQDQMAEAYEKVLADGLTVGQTEQLIRTYLYQVDSEGERLSKEEIESLTKSIKGANKNVDIKLIQTRIKGKLLVEIKGNLEVSSSYLRELLQRLTR